MNVLRVLALLVYTFGAFAYAGLLGIALREPLEAESPDASDPNARRTQRVCLALWSVAFLWFVTNLLIVLVELGPPIRVWPLNLVGLWLGFAFPPLIMHITWAEVMETREERPGPQWKWPIALVYFASAVIAFGSTLAFFGLGNVASDTVGYYSMSGLVTLFITASAYSMSLISKHPRPVKTPRQEQSSRWHVALFGFMGMLFAVAFLLGGPGARPHIGALLDMSLKSLPIAFMFVGTYFEYRFDFFDLFIKRGVALFVTLGVLVLAFAASLPILERYGDSWAAPWVYATVLAPVVMAMPWLHARIAAVLDRRWLGRRFSTVAAVQHFLASLHSATTQEQLIRQAENGLAEIFGAAAVVIVSGVPPDPARKLEAVAEAELRSARGSQGRVLMGARQSEAPYFSEDIVLLESLARVLTSVLENLRLQRREQEQDRRAHDLSLHASRSELKALRAQINPHFLFNALNAIAGLIHRDPEVADRTIEKLADVFRYALRGSEGEWASLEEELEFVRAYLEVEQARFGARLRADVHLDDSARGARVPTMIVQTLVENAIKHGAAAIKGQAVVTVRAQRAGDALQIVVEDNGPGFETKQEYGRQPRGGYGLTNIRQRLTGHFDAAAALSIERDRGRGVTIAAVRLPFLREEPRPATQAAGEVRQ